MIDIAERELNVELRKNLEPNGNRAAHNQFCC
jgi:hypothetical protein